MGYKLTERTMSERRCACKDDDPVWCVRIRYNIPDHEAYRALDDPCVCICHEDYSLEEDLLDERYPL